MASTINELLGGTASNGGSSSTSGGSSNSQTGNGGDRGVVDYGSNGRPATQQPTSDPSENARRMVEQKRQEAAQSANVQQGAASAMQGDSVKGFLDGQAEEQGLNKSVVSKHHPVQETAPVQPAPSSDTGKQGLGGYLNDDGEIDTDKLRSLSINERMKVIDQWLRRNPEETPEDAARKQRRERWRNVYSALGDGIASLANLYYTTRYAPNAYDPTQGLTARAKERYDRLQKERANTIEERLKMYDRLSTMADDFDAMEIKKQTAKANADYKASEAKRKADLAAAQQEVLKARAAKDSAATALAEKKLEYMVNYGWPAEQAEKQAKIELDKARTKAADASATNSYASANAHDRSNPMQYYAKGKDGKIRAFSDPEAADRYAIQNGTYVKTQSTSTSTQTSADKNKAGKKIQKRDKNGKLVYDKNGKPVYETSSKTTVTTKAGGYPSLGSQAGKHSGFSIHK